MSDENASSNHPVFDVPTIDEMGVYLPQFEFKKLAACGGMGAVFKAYQPSLDRMVAVKILPPEFGKQQAFATLFKTEARAMAKLNHTNIVGVYDFGITAGNHLYLVMEWVDGRTLHDLIHKGGLTLRKATNLAIQLCEALTFAHENRIIHRDIKPLNIMVNDADHVKVADFGLARPISDQAEAENPLGTLEYAAPEIFNRTAVDHRVDIYAAGIVLYEMLTGALPENPRRSVTEYAPIAKRWDEIINRATHPDPEKRYQDAGEFRAHISMAMRMATAGSVPEPVEVPKPLAKKAAVKLTQKQQLAVVGSVVGVVVVLFLALIFWPTSKGGTRNPPAESGETTPPTLEEVRAVLAKLEQNDSELARLVKSFGDEWAENIEIKSKDPARAAAAAEKLRAVHCAAILAKAKDRMEGARRAEIVAAELAKLHAAPSVKALKESAAK